MFDPLKIADFVRKRPSAPRAEVVIPVVIFEAVSNAAWAIINQITAIKPVVEDVGFLVVTVVAIFSVAWYLRRRGDVSPKPPTDFAEQTWARFHIYGDERQPQRLGAENIWRWFQFRVIQITMSRDSDDKHEEEMDIFFLTFDRPAKGETLEVSSPDSELPRHEVKDFSPRSAIVVFSDRLQAGTV